MTNQQFSQFRIAIIYDHLTTQFGGAELVLQTLVELFPQAPIYTSVFQPSAASWIDPKKVRTSFLQKLPWLKFKHQLMVILHPLAFESFDLTQFELIISVTAGAAKGVLTNPNQLHLCYQLTPPRYLYGQIKRINDYYQSFWLFSLPCLKMILQPITNYLRRWDRFAAHRPDKTIAISKLVANRIKQNYQLTVDGVLYPPFRSSTLRATGLPLPKDYLICISRLVNYKRIDLAIKASLRLNQILIIVGQGREKNRLVKLAGANSLVRRTGESLTDVLKHRSSSTSQIIFLSNCSETEKFELLGRSHALLMPGLEDFGLTGLEAASVGRPVIIDRQSGIAELLKDKQTAIHITKTTVEAVVEAIQQLPRLKFSTTQAQQIANAHTTQAFKLSFAKMIYQFWQQHSTISAVSSNKQTKPVPIQV